MRVLLLGAGGMLGQDLFAEAPTGVELMTRTRAELDVTDGAAIEREVKASSPDVVLNAAGYTKVDRAEAERGEAHAVNGMAPGLLGRAAAEGGAIVVHFSSDYVFGDGPRRPLTEDDPVGPLSVYGASKLEGERNLIASGARYVIIRSQWLFGLHGPSFPRTMWGRARAGTATRVVNDQVGRPTYTVDLARATWRLLKGEGGVAEFADPPTRRRAEGRRGERSAHPPIHPFAEGRLGRGRIFHIANVGAATWYDMAVRVFQAAGVPNLVTPCSTAEYPTPARRPAWSVLDTTRFERRAGGRLPSWEDALGRFLSELKVEIR